MHEMLGPLVLFAAAMCLTPGPNVVMVSDALWRRRLNGDSAVIGRQVRLDDNLFTVVDENLRLAAEAIKAVLDDKNFKACPIKILLAHATTQEATDLAKQFRTSFDLVVEAGTANIPLEQPEKIPNTRARLIGLLRLGA